MYELTGRLEDLFLPEELFIDEFGYRASLDGQIHRICYLNEFPDTPRHYHIHHIDCNKLNNTLDNLIAIPEKVHFKIHNEIIRLGRIIQRWEIKHYVDQYYGILHKVESLRKVIGNSSNSQKTLKEYRYKLLKGAGYEIGKSKRNRLKKSSKRFRSLKKLQKSQLS